MLGSVIGYWENFQRFISFEKGRRPLDLKSIYTLEAADVFFQNILRRTNFWNRKIKNDFPHCYTSDLSLVDDEYDFSKTLYWELYRRNHACKICTLCCVDSVYEDIPEHEWISYLD